MESFTSNICKTINLIHNNNRYFYSENNKKAYDLDGKVVSEKHKLAAAETGRNNQIISIWVNENLKLEFKGNSRELVRTFPEMKLNFKSLSKVRLGQRKHHKGWMVRN